MDSRGGTSLCSLLVVNRAKHITNKSYKSSWCVL